MNQPYAYAAIDDNQLISDFRSLTPDEADKATRGFSHLDKSEVPYVAFIPWIQQAQGNLNQQQLLGLYFAAGAMVAPESSADRRLTAIMSEYCQDVARAEGGQASPLPSIHFNPDHMRRDVTRDHIQGITSYCFEHEKDLAGATSFFAQAIRDKCDGVRQIIAAQPKIKNADEYAQSC